MRDPDEPEPAFECDICGKRMPILEIAEHKRAVHQRILDIKRESASSGMKPYLKLSIGAALVWLFGILSVAYLAEEWVLAAFVAFSVFMLGVVAYALLRFQGSMEPYYDALMRVPVECTICGAMLSKAEYGNHVKTIHPEDVRTVKIGFVIASLVAAVPTILAVYGALEYMSGDGSNKLFAAGGTCILSITVAMLLVGGYWYPRQELKMRKAWREANPTRDPPDPARPPK